MHAIRGLLRGVAGYDVPIITVAAALPLRQFTNRVQRPINFLNTVTQTMSREAFYARASVTSLKLVFPNLYDISGSELGPGHTATITASIEYPVGTFTQVKFGGSASGTIANLDILLSDYVNVTIPKDAKFYVRSFYTNAAGILYWNTAWSDTADGDAMAYISPTDQTMSGTVTDDGGALGYGPCAIVANVSVSAVALIGDSITYGYGDSVDISRDVGAIARSIGPTVPYINLGSPAERSTTYAVDNPIAMSLAEAYTNRAVIFLGTNDVNAGTPAASVAAALSAIQSTINLPAWGATLPPNTTSSDSWATLGNQTVTANESIRTGINGLVRGGVSGFSGFFELADVLETARNSGFWKSPGKTADGVHPSPTGYGDIKTAAVIDPAVFA